MQMFYNFLLQERAPRIKSTVFTPEMERHEYRKSCNKTKIKAKPNKLKVPEDTEVYKEPEKITVHPVTRCQIRKIDGKDVVVDRKSEDCNPEKKNPILYSGRLKLLYLVDMGVKIENNNLRFHEQPSQQKKYRKVKFKAAMDAAAKGNSVDDTGEVTLPFRVTILFLRNLFCRALLHMENGVTVNDITTVNL